MVISGVPDKALRQRVCHSVLALFISAIFPLTRRLQSILAKGSSAKS
jgi:hypothetical protein